jgi:DNA-binding HxlR family transcriptional regulator
MRYGQFCPIAKAAEILAERWMPLVLHELLAGSTHFSEIHRGVPLMSPTLLSQRLKDLVRAGLVEQPTNDPKRREWRLTEAGRALAPVIHQMGEWGVRYAQDALDETDLDARVLMWNMRRRVDPTTFADERVTVAFDFTDMPSSRRHWWLVSHRGEVDLCPTDPGFPVDVYLTTDVRTMVLVWFGRLPFARAVADGRINLIGNAAVRKRLGGWFLLSPLALDPGVSTLPTQGATETTSRLTAEA